MITQLAAEREQQLRDFAACPMQVVDVRILAEDGAPVGGRNACMQVHQWLNAKAYTDVVVDATGIAGHGLSDCQAALPTVATHSDSCASAGGRQQPNLHKRRVGIQRPRRLDAWIPAETETDDFSEALKLWVVQLSEKAGVSLQTMFRELDSPEEVCPVLPFPAMNPRRADELLFEHREYWQREWFESPLNFIRRMSQILWTFFIQ